MSTPQSEPTSVVVSVGVQCHVGKERTENQDRVTRSATPYGDLFVVADGVGGYQGGGEAAQATIDGFATLLNRSAVLSLEDALQRAASAIGADLHRRSSENPSLRSMGSTVVLCVINGIRATYAHAGDSRAYLLRDGTLRQLTRDHSVMERMVASGILTPEQAKEHPDSSVLTRALGQGGDISLDIGEVMLQPEDALLLCSDGLWAYAPHHEMEAVANSRSLSPSAAAEALLNLALEGGGGDNISIQFLRFKGQKHATPSIAFPGKLQKKTLAAVTVAAVLAAAAGGLFFWNHVHAPDAGYINSSPGRSAGQSTQAAKPSSRTPAPQPGQRSTTQPGVDGPVVIINWVQEKTKDWRGRLHDRKIGERPEQNGTPECHGLARSEDMLFYLHGKAAFAQEVGDALGFPTKNIVEKPKEELARCTNGAVVVVPAKASQAPDGPEDLFNKVRKHARDVQLPFKPVVQ